MKIPKINIKEIDMSKVEFPKCVDSLGELVFYECWKCKYARNRGKAYSKCQDKFIKQGWCYSIKFKD